MNAKKIAILAATFIILGMLYYILEDPAGKKEKKEPAAFVPGFDKASVALISITGPDKVTVSLKKDNDSWTLISGDSVYPANVKPIDKLFETLAGLKEDTIASRNPEKFGPYEVTEDKGIVVHLEDADGKAVADFIVGKNGPDIFSTYVRKKDSNQVVLSNGMLKNIFDKPLNDWRDKTIFKLSAVDIVDYKVGGDINLHMQLDNGTWQLVVPAAVTPEKTAAEGAVKKFADLQAADFTADNDTKTGMDTPKRTVTATFKDGTTKTLLMGAEKNAFQHYVKVQGRNQTYILENHALETLSPTLDKLTAKEETDNTAAPAPEHKH